MQDLGPPVLTLADIAVKATNGIGERVSFPAHPGDPPSASDPEEGDVPVECSPPPGTLFLLGETTVTCVAHDNATVPNETRGSFVVRVTDETAPTIVIQAPGVLEATGPRGATASFTVSATDEVDGVLVPVCQRSNGLGAATVVVPTGEVYSALFPIGDTEVTCSATDHVSHLTTKSFVVAVRDTRQPALALPTCDGPPPGCLHANPGPTGTATVNFQATATDEVSCPAANTSLSCPVSCTPRAGSAFLPGTTTVTCVARDGAGNETTGRFDVEVSGRACTSGSDCSSGFCVDGVCCSTACAGGGSDCQACSTAAGGAINGVCTPILAGKICRTSGDLCDVAEACNGSSTACPADVKRPQGFICRDGTDLCDAPEACDGISAACPADKKRPQGFICRDGTDLCDAPEACDGISAACPADKKQPSGFTCRDSTDLCDAPEACDGTSAACPADKKRPSGYTCRNSAGACDPAETCDGLSAACPADKLAAANTSCSSGGTCPGSCSGSGATCTPNPSCGADTTPPFWSNVPDTIIAYATSASGARVNYTKPKATDAKDGVSGSAARSRRRP